MATLRMSSRFLSGILGLNLKVQYLEVDNVAGESILNIHFKDAEFVPDAEVTVLTTLHDCGGRMWYRSEVKVPGYAHAVPAS
jgi:hypothetical protein